MSTMNISPPDSLEAFAGIARNPAAGFPRYSHELGVPGLRTRPVRRFPFLVFYKEGVDHVGVWRVLHAQRDVPAQLVGTGP